MKKTTRVLSLVLAIMMLFSMFTVAASAKSVEVADTGATIPGGQVLYLKPNANWVKDGTWFAAYFWNGSGNTWGKMAECANDAGYYKLEVPAGSWDKVIFTRMNPAKTALSWDSKWDQTGDLTWDGTNNLFTVDDGQWNNATGKWSAFTETGVEPTVVDPTVEDPTVEDPTEEETVIEPTEEETVVTVSKTVYCINSAKWEAVAAHAWNDAGAGTAWPGTVMTKTEDTVNGFDVYEVTFEADYTSVIFNNNNNGSQTDNLTLMEGQYYDVKSGAWYASLDEVPALDTLASDVYIAGEFNSWSTVANELKLTAEGADTATISLDLAAATTYQFKIVKSGAWLGCSTAITADVADLAFSADVAGNAKITTVGAGTYTFTFNLTDNTLSVVYPEYIEPSESTGDQPATEPESVTPIADAGYYLVGTIGGENFWFVDADSADRMFTANEFAEGEYMLDYTFAEGDEIKVVYFDGVEITDWYADLADNYVIPAEEAGEGTVYFMPDGNADWGYFYFTVVPKVVPPTEDESEATGDQPETEAPTVIKTVYCINSTGWDVVAAHAWNEVGGATAWPGTVMTATGETVNGFDVYEVTFYDDYTSVIFNNNNMGAQTETLTLTEGQYYDIKADKWYASLDEVPAVDPLASNIYLAGEFNSWSTVADELKLTAEGADTATITLDLAAETAYEFKIVNGGSWLGSATAITGDVADVKFDAAVADNATITTVAAGAYVFTYNLTDGTLAVSYPEAPTQPDTTPVYAEKVENITYSATASTIKFNWDAVEGATKYWVYQYSAKYDTWSSVKSAYTNEAVVKLLTGNTTYQFKVIARIGDNHYLTLDKADVVEVTTAPAVATAGITAVEGVVSADLTWEPIEGAVKYWVYKSTSETGPFYIYTSTTETSCTAKRLRPDSTYYFKIMALTYENGIECYSKVDDSPMVTVNTGSASIITTALDANTSTTATISWPAFENADKYWVRFSTTSADTNDSSHWTTWTSTTATSYTFKNLTANTVYYLNVCARYAIDGGVATIDYIPVMVRTAVADENVITFTPVNDNYVTLTWNAVEDVQKTWAYAVAEDGTQTLLASTTENTVTVKVADYTNATFALKVLDTQGRYGYLTPSAGETYHE